ncbi:tetratricopeptide repeat protein [Treponema sp. OMZ 805]|uniref:tetratricopeptide repeat protein n=1 Tax=Treponema sp. OMZ 805 TaxID=2726068 RepID=UPI003D8F1AD2
MQLTAGAAVQQSTAVNSAEAVRNSADRVPKKIILFCLLLFITAAGTFAKGNVDSETAKAYFEIAQAYTEVSKYDKAAEFYLKAAKDPAHKNAAEYNLARVYGLQGDWGKAKNILERQYKDAPGNVLIAKAYSYSLAATGDEARACEMYKKLYDEDSENPEAALNYARILILSKRYDQALSFIEEMKTRFTESTENKAFAELEEKIKKAQEEPEKEDQDKDGKTQEERDKGGTENRPEKGASDSKTKPDAEKTADKVAGTEKDKVSQTKPSADSKKPSSTPAKPETGTEASDVKVKDGKKT